MFFMNFADDREARASRREKPSPQPKGKQAVQPAAAQVGEEELEDDQFQAGVGEEVGVMLGILLPWAISILLHFGVVLLAFFVVWSAAVVEEEEEEIIPEARFLNDNPNELLVYSDQLEVTATTEIPRDIQTQTVAKGDPLSAITMDTADAMAKIGVSGSAAMPVGSRTGTDAFGVGMYGVGGNAKTIVYVVDASGSLIDSLPFVINELRDSFQKLIPEQAFTVIFFQREQAIEVSTPHRGLKKATEDTKRRVAEWISLESGNITPGGSSSPVEALKLALRYRPDLIYVLSDNITGKGRYSIEQAQLLDTIAKAKGGGKTRINTIQFLYPDPLGTLQEVAKQHGGRYRFVDESVLGR